jgi:hypothetical protein
MGLVGAASTDGVDYLREVAQAIVRGNAALESKAAAAFPGEYAGLEALSYIGLEVSIRTTVTYFSSSCANYTLMLDGGVSAVESRVVECYRQSVQQFQLQRRAGGTNAKSKPTVRGGMHALGDVAADASLDSASDSAFLKMMVKVVLGSSAAKEEMDSGGMKLPTPPPPLLLLQESLAVAALHALEVGVAEAKKSEANSMYGLGGLFASAKAAVSDGSKHVAAAASVAAGAVPLPEPAELLPEGGDTAELGDNTDAGGDTGAALAAKGGPTEGMSQGSSSMSQGPI